ncbi:MAG: substrate-binding domain-containing protein [Clostridiales bacterium]|nr:substrate-binding domain-containing protein [Clostridiales bacterium]
MKLLKKATSVCLFIVVMAALLAGCNKTGSDGEATGGNTEGNLPSDAIQQVVDPDDGRPVITIITSNDPMKQIGALNASYAVDMAGYRPEILTHDGTVEGEAGLFDSAIENKSVAIICDVQSSVYSGEAIKKAKLNNIPTFTVNSLLLEEGVAINQFVTNNYEITREAAVEYVNKAGQIGKFSIIMGPDGSNASEVRMAAFTEVLVQYQGLEMVTYEAVDSTDYESEIKKFLKDNDNINGILCVTEEITLAALKVKADLGLNDLVIVGFGGNNEIKEAITSGQLAAAVLPPISIVGEMAGERAAGFLADSSEGFEEIQPIEATLITAENVEYLENYIYSEY